MTRVLIAGATGMAGRSILEALLRALPEARFTAVRRIGRPLLRHRRVRYVTADLTTRQGCLRAAKGCDLAVLASAHTGGSAEAMAAPHLQMTGNLVMDALLLDACRAQGVRRTLFVSSATVYQEFEGFIAEDDLDWNLDPHPAYLGVGWAKRAAEKLCAFHRERSGMEVVVARAANIYGPHARFDPARSTFVAALIRKAVNRLDPFEVLGGPDAARDIIYSSDFGEACARLLCAPVLPRHTYNLGSGQTVTVGEIAELALRAAGHEPSRIAYGGASGVIAKRALDCSRIMEDTGWRPAVSPAEGVRLTTDWWLENRETWTR